MAEPTFLSACLEGTARLEEVDDWIEVWHRSNSLLSLDQFLGFTPEEGARFAQDPTSLEAILSSRFEEQ